MKKSALFLSLLLVCCGMAVPLSAEADDVNPLIGKWVEDISGGNTMVTEFKAGSMASYPVSASGRRITTIKPRRVYFTKVESDRRHWKEYRLDFIKNGIPVESITAYYKEPDTLTLDMGAGTHTLTRVKEGGDKH